MNSMKNKGNKKKINGNSDIPKKLVSNSQSDIYNSVSTKSSVTTSEMTRISRDSNLTNGSFDSELDTYGNQYMSEDLDLHLDLEDLDDYTDSDSEEDEEDSGKYEDGSKDAQNISNKYGGNKLPHLNNAKLEPQYNGSLVPYNEQSALQLYGEEFEGEVEVDSDEERDIMREIREEIQQQVRQEMKPELQFYQTKLKALEQGDLSDAGDSKRQNQDENLNDIQDPKIKEAILKMRKLDKILAKKMKREKEVKRERLMLERRLREELTAPKADGQEKNPVVKANADKYLALALPPSHNEGVEVSNTPEPPVFTTQLNEKDYPGLHNDKTDNKNNKSSQRSNSKTSTNRGQSPDSVSDIGSESSSMTDGSTHTKKGRKKRKNFIKRNKKLAADAEQPIPMTEEEKKRVEGLLHDLDSLPELPEETDQICDDNPFQIAVHPGEGFHPDAAELRSLIHIDSRLKGLMAPEEYESIASHSTVNTIQHRFFTPVTAKSALDFEKYGEKALLENKEQRDLRARLLRVEEELAKLHNPDEIEIQTPTLQEGELNDLIDQCVRSISRTSFADVDSARCNSTENNTPRSPSSAREHMLENPPYLPSDVLQKLLTDAYCPVTSGNSRLSTLREEEENNEDEPLTMDSISAETWKCISEQTLDDEDMKLIAHGDLSQITARSLQYTDRDISSRNYDKQYYHSRAEVSEKPEYGQGSTDVSESSEYHQGRTDLSQSSEYISRTNPPESFDFELSSRNSSRHSDWNGYVPEHRPSQIPVLPEINRSGNLISQDLNNQGTNRPSSVQSNRSVLTVRNSFPEAFLNDQDGLEIMSIDGESTSVTPVPKPPSGEKHTNLHHNKSRVLTPSK